MTFSEERFPVDINYGSSGGPMFNTSVFTMTSGHEARNRNWSAVRHMYNVGYGIKTQAQIDTVRDFFMARSGKAFGFRFRDWSDYTLSRQVIGTTDGVETEFQSYKRYTNGGVNYDREIYKIVDDPDTVATTLKVWVGGTQRTIAAASPPAATEVYVNLNTGIVELGSTLYAASGDDVEIECEFDVPVRFDIDHFDITIDNFSSQTWADIPIIEIRDIT